jgi:hypothetical protein
LRPVQQGGHVLQHILYSLPKAQVKAAKVHASALGKRQCLTGAIADIATATIMLALAPAPTKVMLKARVPAPASKAAAKTSAPAPAKVAAMASAPMPAQAMAKMGAVLPAEPFHLHGIVVKIVCKEIDAQGRSCKEHINCNVV